MNKPREYIVESICGQFVQFIEPTQFRRAFVLVAKPEEATRFANEPSAKVRAMKEIAPSQFRALPVNEHGRVVVPEELKQPAKMRPHPNPLPPRAREKAIARAGQRKGK